MDEFKKSAVRATQNGHKALAKRIMMERTICFALIDIALTDGHAVSVSDGEEWTVKRSKDKKLIREALFSTDEDSLVIRNDAGEKLGWFSLVYGNDGYDVICDHTANDYCETVWTRLKPLIDKYEMA